MYADSPSLIVRIEQGLATLTLNREARRNALDQSTWQALEKTCAALASDNTVRLVVLTGEGKHFCAGADIHELEAHIDNAQWLRTNQTIFGEALDRFAALPQPTIAMIRGSCFGGGMALASACDFRFASDDVRFAITPAKLGLSYRLVDCLRITDLVGSARARELLLTAKEIDGATALAWGMVNAVVPGDELTPCVDSQMQTLLGLSAYSQRAIKANLLKIRHGATTDDDETRQQFADAFTANDFRAAARAFIDKRRK